MKTILITGATGNVGLEVIKSIQKFNSENIIIAGVKDTVKDLKRIPPGNLLLRKFDFTDETTYEQALLNVDILFLLRPPQLSNVEKYIKPIITLAKKCNVQHIVFLSVQGVEKSKLIPHHKIEKIIMESKIAYTFLRPAYFMQNFTTTLHADLVNKRQVFLPAGNAKFTLIDVRDIGTVSANILNNTTSHANKSYELTNNEKFTFTEMAKKLTSLLNLNIAFKSPNLISFFLTKRKEKVPAMYILVLIMLHYFPRFQKEPEITDWVKKITGNPPISFERFITDNKESFIH